MSRVFITGLGALTPIGNDVATFWRNLLAGKSGAGKIQRFDTGDMPLQHRLRGQGFRSGAVYRPQDRTPDSPVDPVCRRRGEAGVGRTPGSRSTRATGINVGVLMATGGGGINEIEEGALDVVHKGWRSVGPFVVPSAMANAVSCVVSIETGARGPVMTSTAACASGHYSILEGYHFLKRGEADVIIAGGTESILSTLTMAAFGRMGPLSSRMDDPEHACRPFSIDRDGFVAGEGAAAVILETEEHARARGARLYAEVLGGKLTGDAFHITAPDPEGAGAARALTGALQMAGRKPEEIDVVYAHGTGTALNDIGEARALKRAFGEAAYRHEDHQHQEHGGTCAGRGRRRVGGGRRLHAPGRPRAAHRQLHAGSRNRPAHRRQLPRRRSLHATSS